MTKPTKWLCAQRRLRSAWASAKSDQSLRCPHEDWADAQADLSLRWAHTHFVGFVMSWLICLTFRKRDEAVEKRKWQNYSYFGCDIRTSIPYLLRFLAVMTAELDD